MSVLSPTASRLRCSYTARLISLQCGRAQFRGNIECNNINDIGCNLRKAAPFLSAAPWIKNFRVTRRVMKELSNEFSASITSTDRKATRLDA